MESPLDITQAFINKKYLVDKGPADIFLYPDALFTFLKKQKLINYFSQPDQLKVAVFEDAGANDPDTTSFVIEFSQGTYIQRGSIDVMLDALLREEQLCPVRLNEKSGRFEWLLAPLSDKQLRVLDQYYQIFKLNIAEVYRKRRDIYGAPFRSSELPDSLAVMFIDHNAVYDQAGEASDGIHVSDESFNPDATILTSSPEDLMKLFKK